MYGSITCVRRLAFDSGHRVFNHEGKCANLHGHSYKVFIHASAEKLDSLGRVVDFSVLKEKFGGWIDENWDHGFLWYKDDPICTAIFEGSQSYSGFNSAMLLKNFRCSFNPTAEEMAKFLLEKIAPKIMKNTGVRVTRVDVHETENCFAVATVSEGKS